MSGGDVEAAVGDHLQRSAEFGRVVIEREAEFQFFVDGHHRPEGIRFHADTDDDDPRPERSTGDDVLDHAGEPTHFENDRARRYGAEPFGGVEHRFPRQHREAAQTCMASKARASACRALVT